MTKLAPEWVRTSNPVIRSPARYRWTTAPAIRSHWDPFQNLMYEMGNANYNFDVIGRVFGMSEGECRIPSYHPLEYTTRTDKPDSKGGIGIYVKNPNY